MSERTCTDVAVDALVLSNSTAESVLAALHDDLPEMQAATLRRYIALGKWVDEATLPDEQAITVPMGHLRTIGTDT